jgi:hypothetical protein
MVLAPILFLLVVVVEHIRMLQELVIMDSLVVVAVDRALMEQGVRQQ